MGDLLTIDELAAWLKLTKRSCYELTSARGRQRYEDPLPFIKLGKQVRFLRPEVEAWLHRLQEKRRAA